MITQPVLKTDLVQTQLVKPCLVSSDSNKELNKEPNRELNKELKKSTQSKFSKAAASYNTHANVQKHAASDLFSLIKPGSNKNMLCVDLGAGPLVNTLTLQSVFESVVLFCKCE